MDVDVLGADDLPALAGAWGRLHAADGHATPFLSHAWALAWAEHWQPRGELLIVRVRDGGEVRGLAPLVAGRRGPLRTLGMLGKEPGDYWDVLAADADRAAVARAAAAELRERRRTWDLGALSCLEPGSPTPAALAAGGLRVVERPPVASPRLELPATFEDYLAALPAGHRSNLRRHLRRLDRGELTLRAVEDPDELPDAMARWRELRARRWEADARSINPEHTTDAFNRFMTAAALALIPGAASLWEIACDDGVAGMYLNFHDARSFYWYLGGFDPRLARLGAGKVAIGHGIRESIAAGRGSFDFTRGTDPYKYWYGARDRPLPSLIVGNERALSRAAVAGARRLLARRERAAAVAVG